MPVIVKHTLVLNAAKAREETLDGRKYLVVPTVLIKDGVFTANQGALYYSSQENGKNPDAWNGMPLVVYHPEEGGKLVTARKPAVLEKSGIGFVFNVEYSSPELKGESWFDIEKTKKVDKRIIPALKAGKTLEVSTGVKVSLKKVAGEFNGEKYVATVHNMRPDHLAILPDKLGACPVKKGCGCGVNVGNEDSEQPLVRNEASFRRIEESIRQAMRMKMEEYVSVYDVYNSFFIYSNGYSGSDRKLLKRAYKVDKEGKVTIPDGDPTPVKWVMRYEDESGNFVGNSNTEPEIPKEPAVNRDQIIKDILACNAGYEASDFEGVPDKTLQKILDKHKTPLVGNNATPPKEETPPPPPRKTLKEWLVANGAPDELHELLDDAASQRAELIGNIMKLPGNKIPQAALEDMGTPTLRSIRDSLVASAPPPVPAAGGRYGNYGLNNVPVNNSGEAKKPKPLAPADPMASRQKAK